MSTGWLLHGLSRGGASVVPAHSQRMQNAAGVDQRGVVVSFARRAPPVRRPGWKLLPLYIWSCDAPPRSWGGRLEQTALQRWFGEPAWWSCPWRLWRWTWWRFWQLGSACVRRCCQSLLRIYNRLERCTQLAGSGKAASRVIHTDGVHNDTWQIKKDCVPNANPKMIVVFSESAMIGPGRVCFLEIRPCIFSGL